MADVVVELALAESIALAGHYISGCQQNLYTVNSQNLIQLEGPVKTLPLCDTIHWQADDNHSDVDVDETAGTQLQLLINTGLEGSK